MIDFKLLSPINPLIILDMANNHVGSLEHGKKLLEKLPKLQKKFKFQVGIKFQYRNLETFIHSDFKDRRDIKYVQRFLSTKFDWNQFIELKNEVEIKGLKSVCTPFDELSVSKLLWYR